MSLSMEKSIRCIMILHFHPIGVNSNAKEHCGDT